MIRVKYLFGELVTFGEDELDLKKKWVTIFPRCENDHITKDVGVIPGIISNQFEDYDCFLVSWRNGAYPDEKKFFPRLQHKFIKRFFFSNWNRSFEVISELLSVSLYLFKDGKSIDVIHFFHLRWYTGLLVLLFKKINPNGKVYVKMDVADSILSIQLSSKVFPLFSLRYARILADIDLISIETRILSEKLSSLWNREVLYIPNGYFPYDQKEVNPDEKNRQLIHVSRMGTYQKNTEFLFEAIVKNQKYLFEKKWKLLLVGEMTDLIKKRLHDLYNEYPLLKKIIEVYGKVDNKRDLWEFYSKSRIFVLTSRYESFGLVLVEALSAGNQILTSNIITANDIVTDKQKGLIYENENIKDFSEKLIQLIENENWKKDSEHIQVFAKEYFYYPTIIERLMRKIDE